MDLKSLLSPKPEEVEASIEIPKKEEKKKVKTFCFFTKNSNSGYQFGNKILRKDKNGFFQATNDEEQKFFEALEAKGELQKAGE